MHTLQALEAGDLAGITRLDLAGGLREFPEAIYGLADSLEVLNLSGNALTSLPHDLHRLKKLRVLFCSDNPFERLPPCLGDCEQLSMVGFKANRIEHVPAEALPAQLRWLILTDNRLEHLPQALGERQALQKLMLAGNRLSALPGSLAGAANLELLRIASNRLVELPAWLGELPSLAWLAYSGNPLPSAWRRPEAPAATPAVPWASLVLGQRLGEGASGLIMQAQQAGQSVAVKLYKGQITSDGSPLDEMAACLAAGQHPALIPVRGPISGHPEGAEGLVMDLIDPAFTPMAGPPSLASCTRDCYPAWLEFEAGALRSMAARLASLCAQLHGRGLMHGDLYAHNLLWLPGGQCLLGDFGAASFYAKGDTAMQRLEVRAFGILLGEWLERCRQPLEDLQALQRACIGPVNQRPLFAGLAAQLSG